VGGWLCAQRWVWLLLSAILWLGNITFEQTSDDTVTVRSDEALANAAELLSVREEDLARALSERTLSAGALLAAETAFAAPCCDQAAHWGLQIAET
jgi:myosin heavy subunit